jgi:hypothetical protein
MVKPIQISTSTSSTNKVPFDKVRDDPKLPGDSEGVPVSE